MIERSIITGPAPRAALLEGRVPIKAPRFEITALREDMPHFKVVKRGWLTTFIMFAHDPGHPRGSGDCGYAALCVARRVLFAEGGKVEQVKELRPDLGSLFINDGKHDRDIERRVNAGDEVNGALLAIMNSKSVFRQGRLAIHNGVLIPTLKHKAESSDDRMVKSVVLNQKEPGLNPGQTGPSNE
ncbi:hypothetical protein EVAR_60404_1 [Eumeta japonica]|uniref:Uncharacterized protein n=1 Tax=Eumeta variegata TaxID=151549 RepID=A0A4C1YS46_EUMVA|nr:hypothetical protein EVAR_60404_1 [Eumeta japonica]